MNETNKKNTKLKVLRKQSNSNMCIICGINNPNGVKAPFYEMEDGTVVSLFNFSSTHQSYPERTHGGLISAMIDEIVGRAIWITEPETWGVTMELKIRYRKPVPYDKTLKAIGQINKITRRTFEGTGKILDLDGNVLAEGEAIYFKLPLSKISSENTHDDVNIYVPDNIEFI